MSNCGNGQICMGMPIKHNVGCSMLILEGNFDNKLGIVTKLYEKNSIYLHMLVEWPNYAILDFWMA